MSPKLPPRLTRRRFLERSLAAGAAVALPAALGACGNDDADILTQTADSATQAQPTAIPTTAPVADPTAEAPEAESVEPAEPTAEPTTAPTEVPAVPAALAIDFTYTMAAGGKPLNPYIAVWIERPDGTSLRTVALWFQQDDKGPRWLDDLKLWWRGDQARLGSGGNDLVWAVSSPTRAPGAYSLLWDGLDDNGAPVTDETVVVSIESARERGPYSLISTEIDRLAIADPVALSADGELSAATITRA